MKVYGENNEELLEQYRYEILDIINNTSLITKEIYEKLISNYGKNLVDTIIESQIDEESLNKYEYYINYKLEKFRDCFDNSYDMYLNDIKGCKKFNSLDNKKQFRILSMIVSELNEIFVLYGYENEISNLSILEKVNFFLDKNKDICIVKKVKELFNKYVNVRNKIIVGNLSLVVSVANYYLKNDNDDLDIIQNGNEGLMIAIDKYNMDKDTTFATYACFWIRNNIIKGLKYLDTPVTVPQYLYNTNKVRIKTIKTLTQKLGRVPSDLEVSDAMKISVDKLRKIRVAFEGKISFAELEDIEDNCEDEEILIDKDSNLLDICIEKEYVLEILGLCRECLTKEEFYILERVYGLNGNANNKFTYQEIGMQLGIDGDKVKSFHSKALKKIRKKMIV